MDPQEVVKTFKEIQHPAKIHHTTEEKEGDNIRAHDLACTGAKDQSFKALSNVAFPNPDPNFRNTLA